MTECWSRVTALIKRRNPTARCTERGARTEWFPDKGDPVRVVLMPSEVAGTPCVTFVAWVGLASGFDPNAVLEYGGRLLEGTVLLREGVYLFRVTVPCAPLDDAAVVRWLDYTARNATSIRAIRKRVATVCADQFAWAL